MQLYEIRCNNEPFVLSFGTRDNLVDIVFYTDKESGEWKPGKKITLNKQDVEKLMRLLGYVSQHLT